MDFVKFAREYAKNACESDKNIFGERFFDQHLELAAYYGGLLADRIGADKEVVMTAAYLHDIAAIFIPDRIPEHAVLGGEMAYKILMENGADESFARKVADCARTHSSPVKEGEGTLEQICVSNADAMTQIARPAYWLHYSFCVLKKPFNDGVSWLQGWITGSWSKMIPQSKELVAGEYEISHSILNSAHVK